MARADEYDHLHLVFYFTVPLMVFLDNLVIVPALERCSWYFYNFQILNCVSFALILNPLMANITKWSNTLKQFVGKLATNCLSVFDHFVGLALKGLNNVTSMLKLWHMTISQNSQENTCVTAYFLLKLQASLSRWAKTIWAVHNNNKLILFIFQVGQ